MVNIGVERAKAGDPGNARAMFVGAIEADQNCADAWNNLASTCDRPMYHDASIALSRRALALNPTHAYYLKDLGVKLWRNLQFVEAHETLVKALALAPDDANVNHTYALTCHALGRMDEAVQHFRRSLEIRPGDINVTSDLSMSLLKAGKMTEGLELHESRWVQLGKGAVWELGVPEWDGADLHGKNLLVHYEQGNGDVIMFARWLLEIRKKWPSVWIVCALTRPLMRLFTDQCGIDEVIDLGSVADLVRVGRRADYHVPIMSILRVMGATFEDLPSSAKPYMRAPVSPGGPHGFRGPGKLAVGIVWKTSRRNERGWRRAPTLGQFCGLAEVPGVRLYSLQNGIESRTEMAACSADCVLTDLSASIGDFADLAVIMAAMDLIISVDTGPLHLAGAMHLPTLLLQQFNPCWRWCKGTEVWYPTVREIKQRDPLSWDGPIAEIKGELRKMVKSK